jgi:hypothetical protein
MPSGSSDATGLYGPVTFAAAAVNVLVLDFVTWVWMLAWYMLPVVVLPVVVVDALIAWGLTRGRGPVVQVGRGMLIGCLVAPLTVVIFTAAWAIAHALGPA